MAHAFSPIPTRTTRSTSSLPQLEFAYAIKLSDGSETQIEYPAGVSISADVGMLQAFNFIFIFRDGLTALQWDGDFTGTPAFALVENGAYAQPVYLDATSNTVILDGLVTVSETAHGVTVGDRVYVIDKGSSSLEETAAGYIVATVPDANSFTFFAAVPDLGAHKVVTAAGFPRAQGLPTCPLRRLPFITSGVCGCRTCTRWLGALAPQRLQTVGLRTRLLRPTFWITNTYDQIYANYRIASGGADFVVAIQPFTEDNLVIFNRNTIHLVRGVSGDLAATVVQEITREVGCLARKSVVQVGNQILFLSDNGVYAMTFEDLYNLRGASIPLSESINPIIKQINPDYAKNAVAIYHDNRYYLSVPIGASIENNAILVYNFLTQGWESVDTVDTPNWNVRNLIRAGADSLNKLYAVNSFGGIHVIDDRDDDNDVIINQVSFAATPHDIVSYVTTRQYTAGTMDRKRYNSFELQLESSESNESDATISLETENPDSVEALDSVGTLLGEKLAVAEDASVRGRCNNVRGYGAQFTISPTQGRPKIRALKLTSQLTDLTISSKQ
jgi:hypothetical protein